MEDLVLANKVQLQRPLNPLRLTEATEDQSTDGPKYQHACEESLDRMIVVFRFLGSSSEIVAFCPLVFSFQVVPAIP
jgi:hypothetical protein